MPVELGGGPEVGAKQVLESGCSGEEGARPEGRNTGKGHIGVYGHDVLWVKDSKDPNSRLVLVVS